MPSMLAFQEPRDLPEPRWPSRRRDRVQTCTAAMACTFALVCPLV